MVHNALVRAFLLPPKVKQFAHSVGYWT